MSDPRERPEVLVIEADEEEEWTPWIGWRKVIVQTVLRSIPVAGIMMGAIAGMSFVSHSIIVVGMLALAAGFAGGLTLSWKLIDTTGIVSRWLMLVFLVAVFVAAIAADLCLGMTSLAGKYHGFLFIYAMGPAWIVSSFRAWMDF
jgi:hypothetical protein